MKYITILLIIFSLQDPALALEDESVMISIKKSHFLINNIKHKTIKSIGPAFINTKNPNILICVDHDAPHSVVVDVLELIKDKTTRKVSIRAQDDCQ